MLDWPEMTRDDSKPHILVVEDARDIREPLAHYMRANGYRTTTASDAAAARKLMKGSAVDLIVLDIMMPGEDGLSLCRFIRETTQTPVILLTARGEEVDRIIGLEMGADDYITKPFNPREVIARIRAFLRRANGLLVADTKSLIFGALTLNPAARTCTVNGQSVTLTPTEFAILETLMQHPGIAYTRETLITESLGYDYAAYERTIDAHIRNIRRKIEVDMRDPQYILTVFGVGYRFAERQAQR